MKQLALLLAATTPAGFAHESRDPERPFARLLGTRDEPLVHLHAGWESRYVSEGRDNLDGAGLISGTVESGWQFVSVGMWYANSPEVAYDELQLNVSLTKEWGDFEAYAGYTHIRSFVLAAHDNEVGLGVGWNGLPLELGVGADAYYSVDAEGAFIEAYLGGEYEVMPKVALSPAVIFGMNQGYVGDGHDGANHLALTLGASYEITKTLMLTGHVGYNFAIDRDASQPGDESLRDFFHGGISLSWSF